MVNITSAITDTISISLFNKGLAGKIFEEVKRAGAKVVMKNNVAECVLISPEEYIRMVDEINDAKLLAIAADRMEHYDPKTLISAENLYKETGISQELLNEGDEVEIE